MELRAFAIRLLCRGELAIKVELPPASTSDDRPGPATWIGAPAREDRIAIAPARAARVPPVVGYADRSQRARILHALANHELQAAELFAWALLAFPDAPAAFRRGLARVLADEQRHFELYRQRLRSLGHDFGDFPVTGHFWNRVIDIASPLDFVCAMGLTFENANLDFAGEYAAAARACGDHETAAAIDIVHRDEIGHVAFALRWLDKLGPGDASRWEVYNRHVKPPLGPGRARGKTFDRDSRVRAGFDDAFIDRLAGATALHPSGRPRG